MIILFAPSEGKRSGGESASIKPLSFIFTELYEKRLEVISKYEKAVQAGSYDDLKELFGIKDEKEFARYKIPFDCAPTMKAIERYDGVAYDYLSYGDLDASQQAYIDHNVILFSNLFGPIQACDCIPEYKLKQGSMIDSMAPEKFYKKYFTDSLNAYIGNQEVLDLRAGFYDKFYTPKNTAMTLKFLKEGKVVSHWAKAYRGLVLRAIAQNNILSFEDFKRLNIDGLTLSEMIKTEKKNEIIYTIG
ncbi:MAG: YaaA family protein [Sulfuricurvum sp.]|nr:YaaA family protein [Sulfuricurvum sp.]